MKWKQSLGSWQPKQRRKHRLYSSYWVRKSIPVNKEMPTVGKISFVGFDMRDMEYHNDKSDVKNWNYFSFDYFLYLPPLKSILNPHSIREIFRSKDMWVSIHTYIHACMCIYTYINVYKHIYTHTYICRLLCVFTFSWYSGNLLCPEIKLAESLGINGRYVPMISLVGLVSKSPLIQGNNIF